MSDAKVNYLIFGRNWKKEKKRNKKICYIFSYLYNFSKICEQDYSRPRESEGKVPQCVKLDIKDYLKNFNKTFIGFHG